ncbi:ATP-binding protein [Clostridium sediminicola]|uniref:ATP-binding protein n=1 Tax=Clostridium sediminicola TaxID=3114879 RepID=UPI0031F21ED3
MKTIDNYYNIKTDLRNLLIYRNIRKNNTMKKLELLITESAKENLNYELISETYISFIGDLIKITEERAYTGNLLGNFILNLILNDSNVFALSCEKYGSNLEPSLIKLAMEDLEVLYNLMNLKLSFLDLITKVDSSFLLDYQPTLNKEKYQPYKYEKSQLIKSENFHSFAEHLIQYYYKIGSGILSNFLAFKWDELSGIAGIDNPHKIELENIIGYSYQKETLIKNTKSFIDGKVANNILLEGARGTGKSSLVKALLHHFHKDGLRLIEVNKLQFLYLNKIMSQLSKMNKPFILFLDDISFEDTELEYKQMKSILDGGIEARPQNVVIYATSNRRHLVKEKWDDAPDLSHKDEIHSNDSINEKLSLSDRFGITLTFVKPSQKEYLEIVYSLAKQNGITLPQEQLKAEAIKWELNQNGRSGRTAEQFINYLISTY